MFFCYKILISINFINSILMVSLHFNNQNSLKIIDLKKKSFSFFSYILLRIYMRVINETCTIYSHRDMQNRIHN